MKYVVPSNFYMGDSAITAGERKGVPLADIRPGGRARLLRVRGGRALCAHLASLGLLPGATFRMVQCGGRGPCIIQIHQARLAVGRGMAARMEAEPLPAARGGERPS